jgi:chemotaxis family two-component system response regulator Rcp1
MLQILLVEDNPADVLLVREGLRSSSIAVDLMIAYDGEQALKLLNERQFKLDFIILDLAIPKFDGFMVLQNYHAQNGPPVVVFTDSSSEQERKRALALGAMDFVRKPIGFESYIKAVRGIVERWSGATATTE